MLTRRGFLQAVGLAALGSFSFGGYAFGIEPLRLRVQRYSLSPVQWPNGLNLKIAALADIHACEPWMSVERIAHIAEVTNSLGADIVVLLGDYCGALLVDEVGAFERMVNGVVGASRSAGCACDPGQS